MYCIIIITIHYYMILVLLNTCNRIVPSHAFKTSFLKNHYHLTLSSPSWNNQLQLNKHIQMSLNKVVVSTSKAPAAIGPYSQAIIANGFVFVSGCIGMEVDTMNIVSGGVKSETRKVLDNMKEILEASGTNLSKVVKTTILLQDMSSFAEVNAIYAEYFPVDPPARATYAVKDLPKGAAIEIECVALA